MSWIKRVIADWLYSRKAIKALEATNQSLWERMGRWQDRGVEALNEVSALKSQKRDLISAMKLVDGLLSTKQPEEAQRHLRLALISVQERF